jgi:hypothetical protein
LDDGGLFVAFFTVVVGAATLQKFSQSSPLLRMKFVISQKAWYVTACSRGMMKAVGLEMDEVGVW